MKTPAMLGRARDFETPERSVKNFESRKEIAQVVAVIRAATSRTDLACLMKATTPDLLRKSVTSSDCDSTKKSRISRLPNCEKRSTDAIFRKSAYGLVAG